MGGGISVTTHMPAHITSAAAMKTMTATIPIDDHAANIDMAPIKSNRLLIHPHFAELAGEIAFLASLYDFVCVFLFCDVAKRARTYRNKSFGL